jgi:rod shape-determining protein MreC
VLPRKRIDQARPFLILGIVALAWAIVPTAIKSFLRASFFEFHAPVSLAAAKVRDLQDYWSLRLHSNDELIAAGRDLGRLTASYETTVRDNAALRSEIERLRALLSLPGFADHDEIVARVSRRDFTGWWQRLEIQKGRLHGLTLDAPVIFAGGLAGRVVELHLYTATVELVSSPAFRLAAVFEGDNRPVSFAGGSNVPFSPPLGEVEFAPLDVHASATEPRQLVTSGLGGIFPPGLAIGQVIELTRSSDGFYLRGEVHLDPRLSELREVTVLVPRANPNLP